MSYVAPSKLDGERTILSEFRKIAEELIALGAERSNVRALRPGTITAQPGEITRAQANQTVLLPGAKASTGQCATVLVEGQPVTIQSSDRSTVNGAASLTVTTLGAVECRSTGTAWWTGASGGAAGAGAPVNAEYIVGAAAAGLTNERVATDSAEVDVDLTTPGVASWVLRAGSVVFAKLQDLAGLSLLGRASNSAGVMAAITATAGGQYARSNAAGTALEFGNPASTSILNTSGQLQRAALTGAVEASQDSNATTFSPAAAGAGLTRSGGNATLDVVGSTSIVVASDQVQRAALTGSVEAAQNVNATTFGSVAPGDSMARQNSNQALGYVGSTSNINTTPTAGDLNVVDISTLSCGGVLSYQSVTEANIDGFTVKPDGFWFFLNNRDATTVESITLIENNGNTTTSIRTPNIRDWRLTKNDSVVVYYSNSRWRVCSSFPKPWATPVDDVTWAAQQNNFTRSGRGYYGIRVLMTGSQTLTGVVPDGITPNGELLFIDNVDSVDTLTLAHDSGSSTAANRFFLPNSGNYKMAPRSGALFRYDDSSARWRLIAAPTSGRLLRTSIYTTTGNTHTWLAETTRAVLKVQASGGGGRSATAAAGQLVAAPGGGAGGYAEADYVPTTASVTANAGAGAAANANGNTSNVTDGTLTLACGGGVAGTVAMLTAATVETTTGGNGGLGGTTATLGTLRFTSGGEIGGAAIRLSGGFGLAGGGGHSYFGAGGSEHTNAANGQIGLAPGAGGAGALSDSATARTGGASPAGIVIIEEWS